MAILDWFNAREAEAFGITLADRFAIIAAPVKPNDGLNSVKGAVGENLQDILNSVSRDFTQLNLNFYRKAKFANSFKWRLLENGIEPGTADEATQSLLMHISRGAGLTLEESLKARPALKSAKQLFAEGNKALKKSRYSDAIGYFQDLVSSNPKSAVGYNNLGSALSKLGRYAEAEEQFRLAIKIEPRYPDPHANLGTLLRWRGQIAESEVSLRHALKLKPTFSEARTSLGLTQILSGNLRDARARFDKVLKNSRKDTDSLIGLGQIAKMEGRFKDAETYVARALEANPNMPSALAAWSGLRKMTSSDKQWLLDTQKIAASGVSPLEEADLRFALGKYYDDTDDFDSAFPSFKRGNELLKTVVADYDRTARTRFVDGITRVYTREAISQSKSGTSTSNKPILVVGMMRSGTSLAEQIIASHPGARGAGELDFWNNAARKHNQSLLEGPPTEPLRSQLAQDYLRELKNHGSETSRVVDKTPVNSDYLGIINLVFPNARIIYMRRDPIDACLSCYFQQFLPSLDFTMDLSDLAHYYREHHRLMQHWRSALPSSSLLEVPYEDLVADQEGWTRRMLDFLELDWDARVMKFYETDRPVITASSWQVRQKMYSGSIRRWTRYEKFIKPLMELRNLSAH